MRRLIGVLTLGISLIALAMPSARAETPKLGTFPSITLSFGSTNSYEITPPSSNSNGSWSYSSSTPSVAVINGGAIIPVGVGSAVITATQAASAPYSSASVSTNLIINKGNPTLGPFEDQYFSYTGSKNSKYTIVAPLSNSSGAWTFTSSNPNVATIVGNVATILSLGVAPITATQAATNNFNAATPVTMKLFVTGPPPQLGTWPAMSHSFSEGIFQLIPPTSPSKGAWSYSSSNPAVATVIGTSVIIQSVGTASITAKQEADQLYAPISTSAKLTITKSNPTVGNLEPFSIRANDPGRDLINPQSNSDGIWNFSVSDRKIATIKNGKLFGLIPGTFTLSATQNESKNYLASQPITCIVTVTDPALPINLPVQPDLTIFQESGPVIYVPPVDVSKGAWTVASGNLNAVRISTEGGFSLVPVGLGNSTITITQAPDGDYAGVTSTFKVTVLPKIKFSVKVVGRSIVITTKDKATTATIDNKKAKIGSNYVGKGKHRVKLNNQGIYFDKVFTVK